MDSKIVLRCAHCGQQNRVLISRLSGGSKCGRCKTEFSAPKEPLDVGDEELRALIAESPLPVVADFWAPWCGPCRMIGPALHDLAGHHAGKMIVAKVNVDENPSVAAENDARSIPLLVGFKKGKSVARQVGALPPMQLASWVERVLDRD